MQIQVTCLTVLMFMNILELICYLVIAKGLYHQNRSMTGILTNKVIQQRKRGSTLTLSGQIISFIVEILMYFFVVVVIKVTNFMLRSVTLSKFHLLFLLSFQGNKYVEPAFLQIVFVGQGFALSVIQLSTSSELQRFLFKDTQVFTM